MLKNLGLILAAVLFFMQEAAAKVCVEHVALDVAAPEATAKWWCENLGFHIKAKLPAPPYAIFIVNSSGCFALELYRDSNTPSAPDYRKMPPDKLHLAFVSDDLEGDVRRLVAAGAELLTRTKISGNELIMLRDPSGIPIQLVKRAVPLIKPDFDIRIEQETPKTGLIQGIISVPVSAVMFVSIIPMAIVDKIMNWKAE